MSGFRVQGSGFGCKLALRRGFTLVEMLTTVALLVIVLGLMIALARDVRTRSAEDLTKGILTRLDFLIEQYRGKALSNLPPQQRRAFPQVRPFIPETMQAATGPAVPLDESVLAENAMENNKELVRTLKQYFDLGSYFSDLSIANYNEVSILDAWGSPLVYMPGQHRSVGMAVTNHSFFFSAGPDRKFLTRQDNLYSYEMGPGDVSDK
jgi:prepilin-type N-terminal cleavage/methylation domain-containing protein